MERKVFRPEQVDDILSRIKGTVGLAETKDCDLVIMEKLRLHEQTGRPLGDEIFMERLEEMVGRILRRQKPGRKKKRDDK